MYRIISVFVVSGFLLAFHIPLKQTLEFPIFSSLKESKESNRKAYVVMKNLKDPIPLSKIAQKIEKRLGINPGEGKFFRGRQELNSKLNISNYIPDSQENIIFVTDWESLLDEKKSIIIQKLIDLSEHKSVCFQKNIKEEDFVFETLIDSLLEEESEGSDVENIKNWLLDLHKMQPLNLTGKCNKNDINQKIAEVLEWLDEYHFLRNSPRLIIK